MTGKLEGKVALVTGASRGIGRAITKAYANEGAHVIAVARTVGALESLDDEIRALGGSLTIVPLDLKEFSKIESMAYQVMKRFGKLDIFVGNAGILGKLAPMGHMTPSLFDDVMAINLHANWHFIRAFDPLWRQAKAARVFFVTSGAATGEFPYWGPYAASKAGLNAMVKTYAGEVEKTNMRVNLLDPGIVQTSMRKEAMPGEDASTLPAPEALGTVALQLVDELCPWHGNVVNSKGEIKE